MISNKKLFTEWHHNGVGGKRVGIKWWHQVGQLPARWCVKSLCIVLRSCLGYASAGRVSFSIGSGSKIIIVDRQCIQEAKLRAWTSLMQFNADKARIFCTWPYCNFSLKRFAHINLKLRRTQTNRKLQKQCTVIVAIISLWNVKACFVL